MFIAVVHNRRASASSKVKLQSGVLDCFVERLTALADSFVAAVKKRLEVLCCGPLLHDIP